MEFHGKKALILGCGISGLAVLAYLLKKKTSVVCVDKNKSKLEKNPLLQHIPLYAEEEYTTLAGIDFVVKSPGIKWNHPLLVQAKEKQVPIISEIELGLEELAKRGKRLFGITGSNGKTTTTLLTTHVLNVAGIRAIAVGNVGVPLLSQIESEAEIFVVELSSYQLETLDMQVFDAGVILNITPNHLDHYTSFEEYAKAKFGLLRCLKASGTLYVHESVLAQFKHLIKEKVATFSSLSYRDGQIFEHDQQNCAAAFELCKRLQMTEEKFWEAFTSFQKPPHRIELVRVVSGVRYVNDSKATSPDAVVKALDAIKGEIILIAGGQDKGSGYVAFKEKCSLRVKKVLLIGESAELIQKNLPQNLSSEIVGTLQMAVKRAYEIAKKGQTVLLCPGCASWDQFSSYEERGEVFKKLVKELKGEEL